MENDKLRKNKIYSSMKEFKKEYLPNSYKKELEEKERKESNVLGTGLTKELLEAVRKKLIK